jgi:hypothetical protein
MYYKMTVPVHGFQVVVLANLVVTVLANASTVSALEA